MTVRIKSTSGCNHALTDPCERCAEEMTRPIAMPAFSPFPEAIYEHIYHPWETPKSIGSRRELREECEKRGVYSHSLRDSMHFGSGPKRWV